MSVVGESLLHSLTSFHSDNTYTTMTDIAPGMLPRVRQLIDSLDDFILCVDCNIGVDHLCAKKLNTDTKLEWFESDIVQASSENDIQDVIAAAKMYCQKQQRVMTRSSLPSRTRQQRRTAKTATSSNVDILSSNLRALRKQYRDLVNSAVSSNIDEAHKTCIRNLAVKLSEFLDSAVRTSDSIKKTLERCQENKDRARQEIQNDLMMCTICYTNEKRCAVVPCGHTFCLDCTERLMYASDDKRCYYCRANVDDYVLVRLTN